MGNCRGSSLASLLRSICRFLIAVLVAGAVSISSAAAPESESRSFELVDQALASAVREENLAGLVWSVVSEQRIATGSVGMSNIEQGVVMSDSSKVQVGSVAKTLIATGLLRLVTERKVSLHDPVTRWLPELAFDNPWREQSPLTVRHLLEHTGGLDNLRMWQFLSTYPQPDMALSRAFPMEQPSLLRLRSRPGTQYSYSNMGYVLLAMVIESITNERYEDYLDRMLLKPLSMSDSTFHFISQSDPASAELAMGYLDGLRPIESQASFLRPAGQFFTSARDMAKFSQFLLNGGKLQGSVFIAPEMLPFLAQPSTTDAAKQGLKVGHGLVFAIRDRHGVVGDCHPGTTFGFRDMICLFPEQAKAFFYAINTDNERADYERFTRFFIETLGITSDAAKESAAVSYSAKNYEKFAGFYLPSPNNMAEFEWLDRVFGYRQINVNSDHLMLTSLQSRDKKLLPESDRLFREESRSIASHVFLDDPPKARFSDGLYTYQKATIVQMLGYWMSPLLGALGFAYIVLMSAYRLLSGRFSVNRWLALPLVNTLLVGVPVLLYAKQNFMQFGDLTLASGLLSVITALLPLSLLVAFGASVRRKDIGWPARLDALALLAGLQWCLVLVYWGLLPVKFWLSH